jgi:hypothetical protein
MEGQPFLAPEHSRIILRTSWLLLCVGLYAIYRGHSHLAIAPLSVWLTSLLHWSHPVNGWRQMLDRTVVATGSLWHLWYADDGSRPTFMTIAAMSGVLYCISCNVYDHGLHWESALFHCGFHVLGNLANIYLIVSKG